MTTIAYDFSTGNVTDVMIPNTTVSEYAEFLVHFQGLDIHPHYYQHLEYVLNLPDIYFYLLGIYIAIVGIFGVIGNGLVLYIFLTTKALKTPPNMFIVNLAISDMAFSAINGFPLMTISSFMKRWYFGEGTCTAYALIGGLCGFNSIATLAVISMDRYYVIAYPFDAMRKCTKKRALIQIICVWIWSIFMSFPPLFGFGRYIAEGVMVECSFDYVTRTWPVFLYNNMMFFIGFLLPVFLIAICYINIIRAVSSQAAQMRKKTEKLSGEQKKSEKEKQQNIKLAKIAAVTISLFILSWVPYAVFCMAGTYGHDFMVTPTTTQIPVLFAKASAVWNPVLYALSHPKFRAVLDEKFPFLLCCQGQNIDKGENEQSDVTQTTKNPLSRSDSANSEVDDIEVSNAPGGRNMAGRPTIASGHAPAAGQQYLDDGYGGNPMHRSPSHQSIAHSEVNPKSMTRAANTIFSHLVTAYEGMRVLTTSGDGSGCQKVENTFSNAAFEGDAGVPMHGYYGQPALMPPMHPHMRRFGPPASSLPVHGSDVYSVGMNAYGGPYGGYYGPPPPSWHMEQEGHNQAGATQGRPSTSLQPPQNRLPNQQIPPQRPPPPQLAVAQKQPTNDSQNPPNAETTNATVENKSETVKIETHTPVNNSSDNSPNNVNNGSENLPLPPDELLNEHEDKENSGEYNMGSDENNDENKNNNSNSISRSSSSVEIDKSPLDISDMIILNKEDGVYTEPEDENESSVKDESETEKETSFSNDNIHGDESKTSSSDDSKTDATGESSKEQSTSDDINKPSDVGEDIPERTGSTVRRQKEIRGSKISRSSVRSGIGKQSSVKYEDGFV